MRKALIASLAVAAALIVVAAATGRSTTPTTPAAAAAIPGCAKDQLGLLDSAAADDRRRQPGVPALVRRRREDEAVEGQRPVQRQGLRVRRRLRGREAARLLEGAGEVDGDAVQQLVPARARSRSTSTSRRSRTTRSARRRWTSRRAYYFVNQSVVGRKGKPIASVRSINGLKKYKLGAQVGTTSYDYIVNQIKPSSSPKVYDTNDAAVQALKNGQIDGLVVDLPTAFYVTAVQVPDGKVVGQFAADGDEGALRARPPEGQQADGRASTRRSTGSGRTARSRPSSASGSPRQPARPS